MDNNDTSTSKLIIDPAINTDETKTAGAKTAADNQKDNGKPADSGAPTLSEVIKKTTEDEAPQSFKFSLQRILGGDILNTQTIRRQIWLLLLIVAFMVVYISNRYRCQQDLIKIDNLTTILQDAKYKALSSSSQLTEKSRESNVLNILENNKDSMIQIADQPPYIINVPK